MSITFTKAAKAQRKRGDQGIAIRISDSCLSVPALLPANKTTRIHGDTQLVCKGRVCKCVLKLSSVFVHECVRQQSR